MAAKMGIPFFECLTNDMKRDIFLTIAEEMVPPKFIDSDIQPQHHQNPYSHLTT